METARRVADLAGELGIDNIGAVLNKVRNDADRTAIATYCANHNLKVLGEIPYDSDLVDAERAGQPPLDYNRDAASVVAMQRLTHDLLEDPEPG